MTNDLKPDSIVAHMSDYYGADQSKKHTKPKKKKATDEVNDDPVMRLIEHVQSGFEDPSISRYGPKMLRITRERLTKLLEEPYRKIKAVQKMLELIKVSPNLQRFEAELTKRGYMLMEDTEDYSGTEVLFVVAKKAFPLLHIQSKPWVRPK